MEKDATLTVKVSDLRPFDNAETKTYTNPKTGTVYTQYLGTYLGTTVNVWVAEGHLNFIDEIEFNVIKANGSAWSTLPKGKLDNMAAFGLA